jgi:uncharacterized C2H2 Zn-finger protein
MNVVGAGGIQASHYIRHVNVERKWSLAYKKKIGKIKLP